MGCPTCNQNTPVPTVPCAECNPVQCPTPQPCVEVVSSECVLHVGEDKLCGTDKLYSKGDSLAKIFSGLADYFCEKTHIPATVIAGGQVLYTEGSDVNTSLASVVTYFQNLFTSLPAASGATIVDKTHAELITLRSSNLLQKGEYYRITDFATMYERPDYDVTDAPVTTPVVVTEAVHPIIVLAISNTELKLEAVDTLNPRDIIHYQLDYTTPVTSTPTKGRIIYRKDDLNNETHYDHRTIKFKRYKDGSGIASSRYDLGLGDVLVPTFDYGYYDIRDVKIGNHLASSNMDFDLPNTVFAKDVRNVSFGYENQSGTFLDAVINSYFNGSFSNNVFTGVCRNVNFADAFSGNVLTSMLDVAGSVFSNNIATSSFKNVQLEISVINTDFSTATHVYANYTKKIFKNSAGVLRLSFYDSVDSEQIANITD